MQGSPPDSVHSACSLGLEMLPSTFLSDDFPHICDRLKMAANPLTQRQSVSLHFESGLTLWLLDWETMMIPSLGGCQLPLPVSWNAGCGGNVIGLAPLRLSCLWEAHAPWRGHQGWDVMWRKGEAKGHWGTREAGEGASWQWMLCPSCVN